LTIRFAVGHFQWVVHCDHMCLSCTVMACTKHKFLHLLSATFKDLHIENSKNYKRWYYPHHTDCVLMCCWIISFCYSWSFTEISGHKYFTITILTICGHVTFKWQQGSFVVEFRPPKKPPIRRKDLGDISYKIRIIAILSQILLPLQKGRSG